MQTGFHVYCRPATEKKEKLLVQVMEADGQSTSRNSSNNRKPEEKILTRKQSSGKKKNYSKQDIGEQLEKGSLVRFGELETFWA